MASLLRYLGIGTTGTPVEVVPAIVGGVASAGMLVALDPTTGTLPSTMFPPNIGPDAVPLPATEAIVAGGLVNVYNAAGTASVRNADNTSPGKEANGFVTAALASGATGQVFDAGLIPGLSGLTPGPIFLGAGGAITQTVPVAPNVLQRVGTATGATTAFFAFTAPIQRN